MTATIRFGEVADVPAVLALWQDAGAEQTHTDDRDSLERLIDHDRRALIVADSEGHLVGTVIAAWDGWRGSIYRLAVTPQERRTGLGGRLLSEAEGRLAEAGAVRSQAIVVDTDAQAVAFWKASGWAQQVKRIRFVKG